MGQTNGRNRLHIQQLCRLDPPVSGDDLVIIVDQDGVIEAETFDAARNLLDLLGRMGTGIAWIRSQRVGGLFSKFMGSPKKLGVEEPVLNAFPWSNAVL